MDSCNIQDGATWLLSIAFKTLTSSIWCGNSPVPLQHWSLYQANFTIVRSSVISSLLLSSVPAFVVNGCTKANKSTKAKSYYQYCVSRFHMCPYEQVNCYCYIHFITFKMRSLVRSTHRHFTLVGVLNYCLLG